MFSCITEGYLRQIGWSEARHTDTALYERVLVENGFPVYPAQREFLARFGGLQSKERRPGGEPIFDFNVLLALDVIDSDMIGAHAVEVGSMLSPIGEMYHRYRILAMAETGAVYSLVDDDLCLIGMSGEEAVEYAVTRAHAA
jgi:hypothetical protein